MFQLDGVFSYCNSARLNFQAFALRDMNIPTWKGCRVGQKMSYHFNLVFANWTVLTLEETFLSMCRSSRAIIFHFNSKLRWQMFLLLCVRHVCVPQNWRTQTWRLHTKLYKFRRHSSANNARMKNSRELSFGEVVYMSFIYRIPDSWLKTLNGYDFRFDHMTGENRE